MTSRLSTREIVRDEIQQLFHQTFNLVQSTRQLMLDEAGDPDLQAHEAEFIERLGTLVGLLEDSYEQLRARILPLVG